MSFMMSLVILIFWGFLHFVVFIVQCLNRHYKFTLLGFAPQEG